MAETAVKLESKDAKKVRTRAEKRNFEHVIRTDNLNDFVLQRSAACACGGECPTCEAKSANLPVSHPSDASEIEADRAADRVMRLQIPPAAEIPSAKNSVQRKEKRGVSISSAPPVVRDVLSSGGKPLDANTRAFMEPRFNYDFGGVRIHDNHLAAKSASSINALAYTFGNNIVFNSGQHDTNSESGKRLLAHELAHVVQQEDTERTTGAARLIQRAVGPHSTCAANVHNAPADPIAALTDADQLARDKSLSASLLLLLESFDFDDPALGRTSIFDAYRHWFGMPTQTTSGQWRSRFRTATFATENDAIRHELETFSDRFQRIKDWLDGDITYRCPGTSAFTISGCASRTCGGNAAITCPTGTRRIIVCPAFWDPVDRNRYARYIIHEALHPLFHFRGHATATPAGRARNPGCYQGFVREVFDGGGPVGDCTALP